MDIEEVIKIKRKYRTVPEELLKAAIWMRHRSLEDDTYVYMKWSRIVLKLGVKEKSLYRRYYHWRNNGFKIKQDGRSRKYERRARKLTKETEDKLVDRDLLQSQARMSLDMRVNDIAEWFELQIDRSLLWRIYKRHNLSFKTVDYAYLAKLNKKEEIKA